MDLKLSLVLSLGDEINKHHMRARHINMAVIQLYKIFLVS